MELEVETPSVPTPEELEKGIGGPAPRPARQGADRGLVEEDTVDVPWERAPEVGPRRVYK